MLKPPGDARLAQEATAHAIVEGELGANLLVGDLSIEGSVAGGAPHPDASTTDYLGVDVALDRSGRPIRRWAAGLPGIVGATHGSSMP